MSDNEQKMISKKRERTDEKSPSITESPVAEKSKYSKGKKSPKKDTQGMGSKKAFSEEKNLTDTLALNESRSNSSKKSNKQISTQKETQKKEQMKQIEQILADLSKLDVQFLHSFKTSLKPSVSREDKNPNIINNIGNSGNISGDKNKIIIKNYYPSSIDNKSKKDDVSSNRQKSVKSKIDINKPFIHLNESEKVMLHFMKNLAIIMEGKDQCAAVGYEESSDTMNITRNHFGNPNKEKNDSQKDKQAVHITEGGLEDTFMYEVIQEIMRDELDLNDPSKCQNILKILIDNLEEHNNCLRFEIRSRHRKKNIEDYLLIYLNGKRVTKETRESLRISTLFGDYKTQNRILRFSSALINLRESKYFNENIKKGKIKFKILHFSKQKVHAELKLLDYYLDRYYFHPDNYPDSSCGNKQINNINKSLIRKIYVTPSRFPCKDCKSIIKSVNDIKHNLNFIYPEDKYETKFKCYLPNFLELKNLKKKHKDFIKISNLITDTQLTRDNKKEERPYISANTDKNSILESPFYAFDEEFLPDSANNMINKTILINFLTSLLIILNRNLDEDETRILHKIANILYKHGFGKRLDSTDLLLG